MRGNVICQRIENGERCQQEGKIWHHLISPRVDKTLMYVPSNLVRVCRKHHSDMTIDTQHQYVPTITALGMAGEIAPEMSLPVPPSKPAPQIEEPLFYTSGLSQTESAPNPAQPRTPVSAEAILARLRARTNQ